MVEHKENATGAHKFALAVSEPTKNTPKKTPFLSHHQQTKQENSSRF
jgi:hypothetical protein